MILKNVDCKSLKIRIFEKYYIWEDDNHKRHRENEAAFSYFKGTATGENSWWYDGMIHRIGGPALTRVNNNYIHDRWWQRYDKYHRLNAPARIYNNNYAGSNLHKDFYEFGILISRN